MVERTEFSEEDMGKMRVYALELAKLGGDAIHDLRLAKVTMAGALLNMTRSSPLSKEFNLFMQDAIYDLALMGEVIRMAEATRQLLGLDEMTNLLFDIQDRET